MAVRVTHHLSVHLRMSLGLSHIWGFDLNSIFPPQPRVWCSVHQRKTTNLFYLLMVKFYVGLLCWSQIGSISCQHRIWIIKSMNLDKTGEYVAGNWTGSVELPIRPIGSGRPSGESITNRPEARILCLKINNVNKQLKINYIICLQPVQPKSTD